MFYFLPDYPISLTRPKFSTFICSAYLLLRFLAFFEQCAFCPPLILKMGLMTSISRAILLMLPPTWKGTQRADVVAHLLKGMPLPTEALPSSRFRAGMEFMHVLQHFSLFFFFSFLYLRKPLFFLHPSTNLPQLNSLGALGQRPFETRKRAPEP